ncbi:MAG: DUF6285 domain-containing protein [Candidatus Methylomirabilia bacterium]
MQDRPTGPELLNTVRDFLEEEVVPGITDRRLKYQILIALNLLRILEREVPGEEGRLRAELDALHDLLGLPRAVQPTDPAALRQRVLEANRQLCERIRRGLADTGPWRQPVFLHVRAAVEEKLRINNPTQLEAVLEELADE